MMDHGIEQQRAHLKSLETILTVGIHDQVDPDELVRNIAKQKENIARLEEAQKMNEKVKAQTGPLPGNGEVNLDYPYSHSEGQSELGTAGELRKAINGVNIDELRGLKPIRPEDQ